MRNALLVTSLCYFFFSPLLSAQQADDAESYWKDVTLKVEQVMSVNFDGLSPDLPPDFENAETYKNQNCYKNKDRFAACVKAIQFLGTMLTPKLTLIATTSLNEPYWSSAKPVETISLLTLVEAPDDAKKSENLHEKAKRTLRDRKELLDISQQEIAMTSGNRPMPVDFHAVVEKLMAKLPPGVSEGKVAVTLTAGYFASLDAHSHFDSERLMSERLKTTDVQIEGIGVPIGSQDNLTIVASPPIVDTPAEAAGLKTGDFILEVDHKSTESVPLSQVVKQIRGPAGSVVHLKIRRGTQESELDITRARFVSKNVSGRLVHDISVESQPMQYGYIKLKDFEAEEDCDKVKQLINEQTAAGAKGFIVDVRKNPGGLMTQAICISSLFVGQQPVLYVRNLMTKMVRHKDGLDDAITDKPVVVLIDGESASASEILAGSLQGLRRAFLVGVRSFGKGSVQTGRPYDLDPAIIQFKTTDQFYVPFKESDSPNERPGRRSNQMIGVSADFETPNKPDATEEEKFALREAEIFPGALKADTDEWIQVRPEQVRSINTCLEQTHRAETLYKADPTSDYQLLKSEDVLTCQISLAL